MVAFVHHMHYDSQVSSCPERIRADAPNFSAEVEMAAFAGLTSSWPLLAQNDSGGAGGTITLIIQLVIFIAVIAGFWMTFTKAGKPGWASIIPIYNGIVLLEIAGKPLWWIILFFIPCVNFVIAILVAIDVAKAFGKGIGFGLGLAFLPFIFYPILGFSDARYIGPQAS